MSTVTLTDLAIEVLTRAEDVYAYKVYTAETLEFLKLYNVNSEKDSVEFAEKCFKLEADFAHAQTLPQNEVNSSRLEELATEIKTLSAPFLAFNTNS